MFTTILPQGAGGDRARVGPRDRLDQPALARDRALVAPSRSAAEATARGATSSPGSSARTRRARASCRRSVRTVRACCAGCARCIRSCTAPRTRRSNDLPVAERARRMADPALKATIMADAPSDLRPRFHELMLAAGRLRLPVTPAPRARARSRRRASPRRRPRSDRDPEDLLYDWTIADDGEALVHYFLGGNGGYLDASRELLVAPGDRARTRRRRRPRRPRLRRRLPVVPALVLGTRARARHASVGDGRSASSRASRLACTACATAASSRRATRPTSTCSTPTRSNRTRSRSSTTSPPEPSASSSAPTATSRRSSNGEVVQRNGEDTGARPGRVVRGASAAR